jgi:hypothetical protein
LELVALLFQMLTGQTDQIHQYRELVSQPLLRLAELVAGGMPQGELDLVEALDRAGQTQRGLSLVELELLGKDMQAGQA